MEVFKWPVYLVSLLFNINYCMSKGRFSNNSLQITQINKWTIFQNGHKRTHTQRSSSSLTLVPHQEWFDGWKFMHRSGIVWQFSECVNDEQYLIENDSMWFQVKFNKLLMRSFTIALLYPKLERPSFAFWFDFNCVAHSLSLSPWTQLSLSSSLRYIFEGAVCDLIKNSKSHKTKGTRRMKKKKK